MTPIEMLVVEWTGRVAILLWAYAIGEILIEGIWGSFRGVGRPSNRKKFIALVLAIILSVGIENKADGIIQLGDPNGLLISVPLIILGYFVCKEFKLL